MKKQFLFAGILAFYSVGSTLTSCADPPSERRQEAVQDAKEDI